MVAGSAVIVVLSTGFMQQLGDISTLPVEDAPCAMCSVVKKLAGAGNPYTS